ncbi:MAG: hypothetical protein KGL67_01525 [Patescibacteria group bacterium]|nr:hypothetical protein [Patescibacteria group bacterium]
MEKIDEQLNNLSSMEVPDKVHNSVMQRIHNSRLLPMLFIIFTILVLSLLINIFYINSKLIDVEFVDMMRDFLDVFSFSFAFINVMLVSFFEIISPMFVLFAVFCFIAAIYVINKIRLYRLPK